MKIILKIRTTSGCDVMMGGRKWLVKEAGVGLRLELLHRPDVLEGRSLGSAPGAEIAAAASASSGRFHGTR